MKIPALYFRRLLAPASALAVFSLSLLLGLAQSTDGADPKMNQPRQHYYEEMAKAPEKAQKLSNPFADDPDAPLAGRKLFEQHCSECHGGSAEGGRRGPSLRAAPVRTATPGTLFWILTNGVVRRGMPVWSKLPEQQRWQIVSYLKSLN
jgi:mono/diheme cytochrome c family protein